MSTCFSTWRSARPGMSESRALVSSASARRVSRSSPKILSAISARTPESMWSSRCEIGWPTLTLTGSTARRPRMSVTSSGLGRDPGFRSISRSEEWTPSACSSSSARPVRRPMDFTSCISRSSRSATSPIRLLSASEMPGLKVMLTVNEPSLNGGRKVRGRKVAASPAAATARPATAMTGRPCPSRPRSRAAFPRLSHLRNWLSCSSSRLRPGSR